MSYVPTSTPTIISVGGTYTVPPVGVYIINSASVLINLSRIPVTGEKLTFYANVSGPPFNISSASLAGLCKFYGQPPLVGSPKTTSFSNANLLNINGGYYHFDLFCTYITVGVTQMQFIMYCGGLIDAS